MFFFCLGDDILQLYVFPSVLSTGFVCAHAMDVCALGALGMFYAVCIHDFGVLGR